VAGFLQRFSVCFDITFCYDNITTLYFAHAQYQVFMYPFIVYILTGVNDRLTIANCLY